MSENCKIILTSLFSFLGVIFKNYSLIFLGIIFFMTSDYLCKFICMKINGDNWDNKKAVSGFWFKLLYLLGFGLGCSLDFLLPSLFHLGFQYEFNTHGLIGIFCGMYIIFNEIGSIKRNCDEVGIKILPSFITNLIDKITIFLDNGVNKNE